MIKFRNVMAGLAVAAFAGTASAGNLGPDGLNTAPSCGAKATMLKVMKEDDNDLPTGLTASNKDWKMEILADPQDGSWTLIGESLKVGAQKNIVCSLNSDIMGFPAGISKETFYQKYFASVPANQERLNQFIRALAAKDGEPKVAGATIPRPQ